MEYDFIKQEITSILESDKTKNFLIEYFPKTLITKPKPVLNSLIKNVFDKDNIFLNRSGIHDLVFKDKKILVRLHLFDTMNRKIHIKTRGKNYLNIEDVIDDANNSMKDFNYILLLRVFNEMDKEKNLTGKYYISYCFFPMEEFFISDEEKELTKKEFEELKKRTYSGKTWLVDNLKSFYLKYHIKLIVKYKLDHTFYNN